nr:helix-turn-helix domain-containing protein [Nocardioides zhouii]
MTEAAARLQVSRKTIYAWVRNGKLLTTSDEAGRTRIRLDDE